MTRPLKLVVAAVLLASALLTGCGGSVSAPDVPTKVVTDITGRQVTIPAEPMRVACLYASTAHMMALVGVEDRIVGAPGGVKRDVLMLQKYPGIADIAIPYQEGTINIEELANIESDLALVRRSTADSPGEVEKLDKLGIPYVVVDYTSIEELRVAIRVVGDVFDRQVQTAEFLEFYDDTLDLVESRIADLPPSERPRVYHAVNEASRTDRAGDICAEITDLAGVSNVSVDSESSLVSEADKTYTTLEQIYRWDPDHIIANDVNSVSYMLSDSKWSGLRSVVAGRVHPLPVGVTRWVHPGSMEPHMGALFLARQFHPDRFTDIDMAEYTKDYYARFFDLDLTDTQIRDILLGQGMRFEKGSVQ